MLISTTLHLDEFSKCYGYLSPPAPIWGQLNIAGERHGRAVLTTQQRSGAPQGGPTAWPSSPAAAHRSTLVCFPW